MYLLHHYFEHTESRLPAKAALVCRDRRWTYRDLLDESRRLACVLKALGVSRQDRVAVFMDNDAEAVISMIGILMAGGVFVILNGTMKSDKLAYILEDSGARALITSTGKARAVQDALGALRAKPAILWKGEASRIPSPLAALSTGWDEALSRITDPRPPLSGCIDQDLAALIYTSGSTGEPKGVMSPHCSMIAAARSIIRYLGNRETDVVLDVLPLSFDYGLYQVIMSLMFGGTVVLEKSFLYIHPVLKRIEEEGVTGFPVVPSILAMILGRQDLRNYRLESLRFMTNTGAALPEEHIRRVGSLLPDVKLYSMFGLTECKRVCYLPPEELPHRPGSVGRAMPNCEVWIEGDDGRVLGPGETGELVVRGANVMRGYWNSPDLSAKVFRPGRYPGERVLYTGDRFRADAEGYLYFVGRNDDMIKCRGERVSPKEVENVLHALPGVREAAVIGAPDEIEGQSIVAFVVPGDGSLMDEKAIRKHCAAKLEPFCVPRHILVVEELPRSANGKIDRKMLQTILPPERRAPGNPTELYRRDSSIGRLIPDP